MGQGRHTLRSVCNCKSVTLFNSVAHKVPTWLIHITKDTELFDSAADKVSTWHIQIIKDTELFDSAADKVPTWLIQINKDTELSDSAADKVPTWLIQIIKAADMFNTNCINSCFHRNSFQTFFELGLFSPATRYHANVHTRY